MSATRSQKESMQAEIAKDVNCILEELWSLDPTNTLWKILKGETKRGMDNILTLPKDNILKL